jgi:uncharacterized integral membrane protein
VKRFLWVLAAIAAAAVIVPLGVANRHRVPVTLDPFARLDSATVYDMPLSLVVFLAFMAGLLVGGFVTWRTQSRWRRTSRVRTREAYHWRSEAERLARERDEAQTPTLSSPARTR